MAGSDEREATTENDPSSLETASASLLPAVHLLLGTDRTVKVYDILLATVFECLEEEAKPLDQLIRLVQRAWPGVQVRRTVMEAVLEAASSAGYLLKEAGTGRWALGGAGHTHLRESKDWAVDAMRRTVGDVEREAHSFLGGCSRKRAEQLTEAMIDVLIKGVAHVFTSGGGRITSQGGRQLFPEQLDLRYMDDLIATRSSDPQTTELLSALLRSALDATQPFATEILHLITTGYILFAYMGRRDNLEARAEMRLSDGEVAILDTPVLVQLLGPSRRSKEVFDVISSALNVGVKVVVYGWTIEEMHRMLEVRRPEAAAIESEPAAIPGVLAVTIDDTVIGTWLAVQTDMSNTVTWSEFEKRAVAVSGDLRAMGVELSPPDTNPRTADDRFTEMRDALVEEVHDRRSNRGRWNFDHDARLLLELEKARSTQRGDGSQLWSGAVIVTSDTAMNRAYRTLARSELMPAALSLGQWAGLVAECAEPASAERLAEVMADETASRTLLARAGGLPVKDALELSRNLTVRPTSAADLGQLRMSIEEALAQYPDELRSDDTATRTLGQATIRRYQDRIRRTAAVQRERLEAESRDLDQRERSVEHRETEVNRREANVDDRDAVSKSDRLLRQRGRLVAVIFGLMIAATLSCLGLAGTLAGWHLKVGVLGFFAFVGLAIDYGSRADRPWWEPVGGVLFAVALMLIPLFLR